MITCVKNVLFKNGDSLPECLRLATVVIEAEQNGRHVTAYACDPCLGMINRRPHLARLVITPLGDEVMR